MAQHYRDFLIQSFEGADTPWTLLSGGGIIILHVFQPLWGEEKSFWSSRLSSVTQSVLGQWVEYVTFFVTRNTKITFKVIKYSGTDLGKWIDPVKRTGQWAWVIPKSICTCRECQQETERLENKCREAFGRHFPLSLIQLDSQNQDTAVSLFLNSHCQWISIYSCSNYIDLTFKWLKTQERFKWKRVVCSPQSSGVLNNYTGYHTDLAGAS